MPQVRSPEVAFVFLVREMSVCTACVWALVCTQHCLASSGQAALWRGSNRVGGLVKALALKPSFFPCLFRRQGAKLLNNSYKSSSSIFYINPTIIIFISLHKLCVATPDVLHREKNP